MDVSIFEAGNLLMSIGALAAFGIMAGSQLLGHFLNKPSSAERRAMATANDLSRAQSDEIRRQTQSRAALEAMLNEYMEGGGGDFSDILFQFPDSAGGASHDPEMLAKMASSVSMKQAFDRLMGLSQAPTGNPASSLGLMASQGAAERERRSNMATNLAFSLLMGGFGGNKTPGSYATTYNPNPVNLVTSGGGSDFFAGLFGGN